MTIEEAIWTLENGAWWDSLGDDMSDADKNPLFDALDTALSALSAQQQAEDNSPLTLDELRQMDGEPVYIAENTEYWAVVNGFDERGIYLLSHGNPDDYGYFELYGKTWLAYRHKPETCTTTCTATNQPCSMCKMLQCEYRKEAHHGVN